jgi:hypothetical protein
MLNAVFDVEVAVIPKNIHETQIYKYMKSFLCGGVEIQSGRWRLLSVDGRFPIGLEAVQPLLLALPRRKNDEAHQAILHE